MSLINQMLRDLEARQAADSGRDSNVFHGLTTGTAPRRRSMALLSSVVIAGVFAVAVGVWFAVSHHGHTTTVAVTQPTAPQASTAVRAHTPAATPQAIKQTQPSSLPITPPINHAGAPLIPSKPMPAHTEVRQRAVSASVRPQHSRPLARPTRHIADSSRPPAAFEMRPHVPSAEQRAAKAYREALTQMQQHNTGRAEAKLREALTLNPENIQASEALAALLINQGRVVEAAPIVDAARQHDGQHPTLDLLAARIRLAEGDIQGATAILQSGLSLGGSRPDYVALLAALYQKQGKYTESVRAYKRAVELDPAVPAWWVGLGISEEGAGHDSDAAEAYSHALQGRLPTALRTYAQQRLKALKAQTTTGATTDSGLH